MNNTCNGQIRQPYIVNPKRNWQGRGLDGPLPNKVFIWDSQGTYIDCLFPNPIHGHFLGGETLRGKQVHDVLSAESATVVQQGIQRAMQQLRPTRVWIELLGGQRPFHVSIRIIPGREFVIGLINDYPITPDKGTSNFAHIHDQQRPMIQVSGEALSTQEQQIIAAVVEGKTNQAIARQLQIKERTVKYHLTNIYRKFHLKSRAQLALLVPNYIQATSHSIEPQKTDKDQASS